MSDKRGNGPTYEYDPTGRLTKRTWARGIETDYTYNPLGQLTSIIYSDLETPDVTFTYNRMGQQLTVTDATGTRGFAYDSHLQLIQETNWQATIERSYDTLGRSTGLTLGTNYTVTYTYDSNSRLSSVADFTYTYLSNSDLIASVNNANLQTTTTYEPHRNLKTAINNTFDIFTISSFHYENDPVGRRTQRLERHSLTNHFSYNLRSEIVSATMGTNSFQYGYDSVGNRIRASANEITNLYKANELNQYTNISPAPDVLTYDLDGNLLDDGTWKYTWDAENRMTSASSNDILVIQNQYDYMSRRISKTTTIATNAFIYDGWNLISETQSNAQSSNYYIWGLDLSNTPQGAGGVGGLLTRLRANSGALYYTYDANGNVSDVLDTKGIIVAHYKYAPYGNIYDQCLCAPLTNATPFRFSTKYWDGEAELYDYGYRFYSPFAGRFLSLDPIHEVNVLRTFQMPLKTSSRVANYLICENDPISLFDFLGLYTEKERQTVCRAAESRGMDRGNYGAVICNNGTPYPCLWEITKSWHPEVQKCAMIHEETHAQDATLSCPACGLVPQKAPTKVFNTAECKAILAELECLKNLISNKTCGYTGVGCLGWLTRYDQITKNIKLMNCLSEHE